MRNQEVVNLRHRLALITSPEHFNYTPPHRARGAQLSCIFWTKGITSVGCGSKKTKTKTTTTTTMFCLLCEMAVGFVGVNVLNRCDVAQLTAHSHGDVFHLGAKFWLNVLASLTRCYFDNVRLSAGITM